MVRFEKKKRGFYIIVPSIFCTYLKRNNESIFLFFCNFIIFFQNFLSIFSITFFWLVRFKKRKKRLVVIVSSIFCCNLERNRKSGFFFFFFFFCMGGVLGPPPPPFWTKFLVHFFHNFFLAVPIEKKKIYLLENRLLFLLSLYRAKSVVYN